MKNTESFYVISRIEKGRTIDKFNVKKIEKLTMGTNLMKLKINESYIITGLDARTLRDKI